MLSTLTAVAQHQHRSALAKPSRTSPAPHHGTPKGWTFTLPKGDPAKGCEVFAKLECYRCHEGQGGVVPGADGEGGARAGARADGSAPRAEYFAESIINPSAVIDNVKGYRAPDGSLRMPSFNASLTVQELIDLVAFIWSLAAPSGSVTI